MPNARDYRILGTNHTSFTVSDLDRSCRFFEQVLGFTTTSKGPRDPGSISAITGVPGADVLIAYLVGAGHTVELIEYRGPDDRALLRSRPCDTGAAHIAFDVEGVEAAVAAAGRHGFAPLSSEVVVNRIGGPNAGARVVYLRDADGVTVEFIERPPTASRARRQPEETTP
jgi:catechol 2,3-dioxygenase-like lactoylglutathione lyase family enzyme